VLFSGRQRAKSARASTSMSVWISARTVAAVRLVVDQAHLADVVARLQHRQDDLAAAAVGGQHAGAAVEQDEQRVALAALLDHQFAAAEAALDHAVGDGLGLVGGEHREQRHAADQVQVGQHRHRRLLCLLSANRSPKHRCLAARTRLQAPVCKNPAIVPIAPW
jgi:hypothetical protein